jgi:hypothetical protein
VGGFRARRFCGCGEERRSGRSKSIPRSLACESFRRWQDPQRPFQGNAAAVEDLDYKAAVCYARLRDNEHARRILSQIKAAAQKALR